MAADATFEVENEMWAAGSRVIAGVDEVGRGAIAGPLVVGAVAVPAGTVLIPGLRDSKLLSAARRAQRLEEIRSWAPAHALGVVPATEVDEVGMAAALRLGVARALAGVQELLETVRLDSVIVDGPVNLAGDAYEVRALPKADMRCATVAAASIVAKVWRDEYMAQAAVQHPGYGFDQHKGYGTAAHYAAIDELGMSVEHRTSFKRRSR